MSCGYFVPTIGLHRSDAYPCVTLFDNVRKGRRYSSAEEVWNAAHTN